MDKVRESDACRSATASPVDTVKLLPAALFILFVGGYWGTTAYLRNLPVADKFDPVKIEFGLWAAIVGALGGFAAAAGLYFVFWLVGMLRVHGGVEPRIVALWLAVVIGVGGSVLGSLFLASSSGQDSVDKSLAVESRPITLFVAACLAPGLMGFLVLRSIARTETCWTESGACRLLLVLRLRTELRRLLAILGGFLTLLVIGVGMRRRALLALDPNLDVPAAGVLLYGLIFAAMLGLFYLGANSAIDARAGVLLDEFAALPDPSDEHWSDALHRRSDFGGAMGLGAGSFRTFESTVVVAAPLISALIGVATG